MKRLALACLLAAGAARAQMKMPDVREMSGIPRPDQQVAAGTLTVRVAQGELSRRAPEGTPVFLVGLSAGGKIALQRGAVNADGRAEFTGLARDGSIGYYALCVLGEDRLASEVISLPPEVGVRVMLAGRKLDADGKAVGQPVDDLLDRLPEGVSPPEAGSVEVILRGRQTSRVRILELGDEARTVAEGDPDRDGAVRLTGVKGGADRVYIAEVRADGRSNFSTPFMMTPRVGASTMVIAYGKPLLALQGGAVLDDAGLDFEIQFQVVNATGTPFDAGKDGLALSLPVGARGGNVQNDMARPIVVDPERGVVWKGIIPPGQHAVVVRFFLPSESGAVDFNMPAPLGIMQASLFVENVPGMEMRGGKGPAEKRTGEDGREFMLIRDLGAEAGKSLSFHVSGLPVEPAGQRRARLLVGLLVALLLGGAAAAAVWPRPTREQEGRSDLEKRRDRLYDELVSLERKRAAGKIEAEQFDHRRKELVAKLVWVHRQIDEQQQEGRPEQGERRR